MWLSIARQAQRNGLRSNATMLYGHVETEEERVDHLVKLRELQDQTHGFVTFIPLAFHPDNTALSYIPKPTGYADLRNIAVARLLLDNFDQLRRIGSCSRRASRRLLCASGPTIWMARWWREKIYHDAGAKTSEFTPRAELERLIRAAGRVAVERDTLYRPVDRSKLPPVRHLRVPTSSLSPSTFRLPLSYAEPSTLLRNALSPLIKFLIGRAVASHGNERALALATTLAVPLTNPLPVTKEREMRTLRTKSNSHANWRLDFCAWFCALRGRWPTETEKRGTQGKPAEDGVARSVTERERWLLDRVELLEKRVAELEINNNRPAASSAEIDASQPASAGAPTW